MIIADLQFEYEDDYRPTSAYENINIFIKAIKKKNHQETTKFHYVILIDEVMLRGFSHDLTALKLDEPNIDVHIAINPLADGYHFLMELPDQPNTYCAKLTWKHRNSLEICLFLSHLRAFIENKAQSFSLLSGNHDAPLMKSCFYSNKLPIWIMSSDTLIDEEILDSIQEDQSLPNDQSVTLLYTNELEENRKQNISTWCQAHNWNFVYSYDMYGSESSVIVTYELDWIDFEFYSRAKKHLIMVTR